MTSRARVAVCAVGLAAATLAYRYLSFEEFPNDPFVHLSIAQQIVHGALPVRDFVERGIPLMSMLSAAAQVVLGEGLRSELILIASAYAVTASLTFLVAAWLGQSLIVGVLASLVPVLAYPVSYSYPKLLAPSLAFLMALGYARRPTRKRLWLVAAAIAAAFLLRHDLGLLVGVGVAALLAVQRGLAREGLLEIGRVAVAAMVLVSPYLAWVQLYQGLGDYARQGLAFSAREAERANWWQAPRFAIDTTRPLLARMRSGPVVNVRWQPDASEAQIIEAERRHGLIRLEPNSPQTWRYIMTDWAAGDLEALVRDPLAADTQGIDRSSFALQVPAPQGLSALLVHAYGPGEGLRAAGNLFAALLYLVWLLPIAALAALVAMWRRSAGEWRGMVAMVIAVQLFMDFTMLRDPLDTRARDVVVPLALLLSCLGGLVWAVPGDRWHRYARRGVVLAVLVMVMASAASLGAAPTMMARTRVGHGVSGVRDRARVIRRRLAPPDQRTGPRVPAYQPIVDYVGRCTKPEARLLTLTFAPELFFYTGRQFAGGQVSLSPGYFTTRSDADALLKRVSAEDVPLVIMDSQTQLEMLDDYPRIGAYVRQHYHEVERFPVSSDKAFVVLARGDGPACARLE